MNDKEKKELTPEEARAAEREKWAKTCMDIMAVSKETDCPPEAVAMVVLLNGLNAQAHYEGESLRIALIKLFGKKIEIDPRKLGIIKN